VPQQGINRVRLRQWRSDRPKERDKVCSYEDVDDSRSSHRSQSLPVIGPEILHRTCCFPICSFASLLPRMIAQKLPQLQPRFVQLGLAVAYRAIEQGSDFIVLKPLYIVKHKDQPVARRQIAD